MVSVPSDEPVSSAWFLNIGKPQNLAFGMLIISINTLLKFSSSPKALNDILNTYYQSQSIRWIPDVYTSNCLHELSPRIFHSPLTLSMSKTELLIHPLVCLLPNLLLYQSSPFYTLTVSFPVQCFKVNSLHSLILDTSLFLTSPQWIHQKYCWLYLIVYLFVCSLSMSPIRNKFHEGRNFVHFFHFSISGN